jgi:hypothetical protein
MSRQLSASKAPSCVVDRSVFNADTISDVSDIGASFFAPLCPRNRGVFVLDPSDGNTYGCVSFPTNYAELAGVDTDVPLEDSNAINLQFLGGNITASDTVDLLDYFVKQVYFTTPNKAETPYGCDVGGLAKLDCGDARPSVLPDGEPVRSVTLSGTFVPASWAGPKLSLDDIKEAYPAEEFHDMAKYGLNTVQVPVFTSAFESDNDHVRKAVEDILGLASDAGLSAILVLVKAEDTKDMEDAVISAAKFASAINSVVGITLPSPKASLVDAARTVVSTLPLLLPINEGDLQTLHSDDANVYGALAMSHTATIGDVASSTSTDDRMKLFYHEATSCISRSPIEYATCFKKVPVLISSGFDLAIDDCVGQGDKTFKDYGQCDRFDETIDSPWWKRHRKSFAARQVFAYERGLGWSFATWKLHGNDSSGGAIDSPAKLLSFKDVASSGLMPSLEKNSPATLACLNGPEPDFILGDETLSPTPGPPPDCGNGWWNFTTSQCDYWIPPPPPKCESSHKDLGLAALGGSVVTAIIGLVVLKIVGGKKSGYSPLP